MSSRLSSESLLCNYCRLLETENPTLIKSGALVPLFISWLKAKSTVLSHLVPLGKFCGIQRLEDFLDPLHQFLSPKSDFIDTLGVHSI